MFPSDTTSLTRRGLLAGSAATAFGILGSKIAQAEPPVRRLGGNIHQSVAQWCFQKLPLETLARECAAMGVKSIELVDPKDWSVLKQHGLMCGLTLAHWFDKGVNNPKYHEECIEKLTKAIEVTSAAGWPNVITFSGMREGLSDEEGIRNSVTCLKKVMGLAEKQKVNLCLEPLNTRVAVEMKGHPGYHCDKVEWAMEVIKQVGSPRLKLLFDVYHVQIMQGDIITRIKECKEHIGHYHTAGVPGRGEIDDTQEINYPAVMKVIAETGFPGLVAQEFLPVRDPLTSLRQAVKLCDV
jgi:hydroxypyruvate isomerase